MRETRRVLIFFTKVLWQTTDYFSKMAARYSIAPEETRCHLKKFAGRDAGK
jgi:hypothetical protein